VTPPAPTPATDQTLTPVARRARRMAGYSGDGFSSSVELVATPVLFILGGMFLDRKFNTGWVFAAALGTFAVVGTVAKQWYVYNARMQAQEDNLRLARQEADQLAAAQRQAQDDVLAAEQAELAAYLAANRPAEYPLEQVRVS
jgi:hypothetical protein